MRKSWNPNPKQEEYRQKEAEVEEKRAHLRDLHVYQAICCAQTESQIPKLKLHLAPHLKYPILKKPIRNAHKKPYETHIKKTEQRHTQKTLNPKCRRHTKQDSKPVYYNPHETKLQHNPSPN